MNIEILKSKLTDFGLDPRDWVLEIQRVAGGLTQVRVSQADLHLIGWADEKSWLILSYQG